eukprot:GFUD01140036.1.p1 GENE.GFUD01140036.1~~GFUD01140036.1.p1  ORF type:complete len:204 (+),score=44.08 GFUD01140036.1:39-614(+)
MDSENTVQKDMGPLNMGQLEIIQNVSCKMEIENTEIHEEAELGSINLVDKLRTLDQCRLCFTIFSSDRSLRKHEENIHFDDQAALSLTHFTLKDLVYSCDMCPQIPGFLTENILKVHKKLQHKINVKNAFAKCEVCMKVVKHHSLRAHTLIHTLGQSCECKLCYKKFALNQYLKRHLQTVHAKDAQYLNME